MTAEIEIVKTSDRHDLANLVANWLWSEFHRQSVTSLADIETLVQTSVDAGRSLPRTFVLMIDGEPVGTASLAENDLDTRPDLNPWLAGVFVVENARGRGLAAHLVHAVEAEAVAQGYRTLWLYTRTAEHVYARLGWRTTDYVERKERQYALMRRDLAV
jgi:GNAT superfamily N-acetyltransferase